jgi:two-component system OmpR family response regulator
MTRMRALVVEDDHGMASVLSRALRAKGWAADVAGDGARARSLAGSLDYDVIVLDVTLPGDDGFEVCRALRRQQVWAPVLMLTARDAVEDRIEGLDAGADDYLVKPFSFGELFARLRALVRGRRGERPTLVEEGGIRLDPASRRVWRDEVEVLLSAKEFALLETFLRHPGQVLTRRQLLDRVWDDGYGVRSNVVDVYVRYLREKLDRPFGSDSIESVRGVGYRFRRAEVP